MIALVLVTAVAFAQGSQPPADPAPSPANPPAQAPAATPPAATTPAPKDPPKDPSVDAIIKDLEKASPRREVIRAGPESGKPATPATDANAKSDEPQTKLVREGAFLVSRRGRMVKLRTNQWAFVFDADAQGKADAPMILQPCQRLEQMERIAEQAGDSATFTVSGQVFTYRGRNYLLPSLHVVNRVDSNLNR